MPGKITGFIREYIVVLSALTTLVGFKLLLMGVLFYGFNDLVKHNELLYVIYNLEDWNLYLLLVGFFVFFIGVYYLYRYLKNKKFVLKELKTNKRSEFLKKHKELKTTVKYLPSKYQKMLEAKEDELQIK
jgi:hypothetical protein